MQAITEKILLNLEHTNNSSKWENITVALMKRCQKDGNIIRCDPNPHKKVTSDVGLQSGRGQCGREECSVR